MNALHIFHFRSDFGPPSPVNRLLYSGLLVLFVFLLSSSKEGLCSLLQLPWPTSFWWLCCQGVCPRLFKRAVELHEQTSLQAWLHWHLSRSVLLCLSSGQFNVFSELIWNPLKWDSAHLRYSTTQESNRLNSALWRRTVLVVSFSSAEHN